MFFIKRLLSLSEIIFAGTPPIVQFPSIKSLFTTELAAITVLFPITIFPNIFASLPPLNKQLNKKG